MRVYACTKAYGQFIYDKLPETKRTFASEIFGRERIRREGLCMGVQYEYRS